MSRVEFRMEPEESKCVALCWFISRRNKGVSLSYGRKMEAVKFMALLVADLQQTYS